jgi:hypothetical protein
MRLKREMAERMPRVEKLSTVSITEDKVMAKFN